MLAALGWLSPRIRLLQDYSTADEVDVSAPISGDLLRAATFGYANLASDGNWLDAIQYYGELSHENEDYRKLPGMLERVTELDPNFDYAYQFAGQSLPFHDGRDGKWHNTRAAIRLLTKGMASQGQRWQIPWLLGYCLYTFQGRYLDAGHALLEATKRARAPAYLKLLAERLLAQGGDLTTAIDLTKAAIADTGDERTLADLENRLKALYLQGELEQLRAAIRQRDQEGLRVRSLDDLVGLDGLTFLPFDPFGKRFVFQPEKEDVTSPDSDQLLRIYVSRNDPAIQPTED